MTDLQLSQLAAWLLEKRKATWVRRRLAIINGCRYGLLLNRIKRLGALLSLSFSARLLLSQQRA